MAFDGGEQHGQVAWCFAQGLAQHEYGSLELIQLPTAAASCIRPHWFVICWAHALRQVVAPSFSKTSRRPLPSSRRCRFVTSFIMSRTAACSRLVFQAALPRPTFSLSRTGPRRVGRRRPVCSFGGLRRCRCPTIIAAWRHEWSGTLHVGATAQRTLHVAPARRSLAARRLSDQRFHQVDVVFPGRGIPSIFLRHHLLVGPSAEPSRPCRRRCRQVAQAAYHVRRDATASSRISSPALLPMASWFAPAGRSGH